jgi:hypothetical protein
VTGSDRDVRAGLPPWAVAVAEGRHPAPVVLVLGGFLTSPPAYIPFEARLRDRGVADILVASTWLPDWLLAARRGFGAIVTRAGRALLEAGSRSEAVAGGAPVLVVGHSAGGLIARLLTSPVPFEGRRLGASGRIGAIVTLGTPHHVRADGDFGSRTGSLAAFFAERQVPGAAFAPRVGYLAVGSGAVVGRADGSLRERRTWRVYQDLHQEPDAAEMPGDGLIPLASSLLRGVPSVTLDEALHGTWPGAWYGSDPHLDRWWPQALATWRAALEARVAAVLDPPIPGGAFDGTGDRG